MPHSQFVLDGSIIIDNSGGFYHKRSLKFLMDKGLIKRDDELLQICKDKMDNQQTKWTKFIKTDIILGACTETSSQLVTAEDFTGISMTKGIERP